MGRNKRPDTASSQSMTTTSPQETLHFSHPHILKLVNPTKSETLTCNACEQQNTNNKHFYGCNSCQYFLHENCLNAPRSLDHSAHPSHPLTLLPTSTYRNRSYLCNACGSVGNAFCFSCARCQFDIHVQCASSPSSILIDKHAHQLELTFGSPFEDKDINYFCDICNATMNKDYWLYYCADCDFAAHLQCASPELVVYPGTKPINQNPTPTPTPTPNLNANSTLVMISSVNETNQQVFEAHATRMMAQLGQDMLDLFRPTRR